MTCAYEGGELFGGELDCAAFEVAFVDFAVGVPERLANDDDEVAEFDADSVVWSVGAQDGR